MISPRALTIRTVPFLLVLPALFLVWNVCAFSGEPQSSKNPVRVLVTGAAGKTGRIVLSKLGNDRRYEPKGLFRTEKSARTIVKNDAAVHLEHVVVADVTSATFLQDLSEGTIGKDNNNNINEDDSSPDGKSDAKNNGLENLEAMIICTSAVPRIRKRSLAAMLVKAPWRALKGEPVVDVHSMDFAWKYGGYPEKVDYEGQIAQIDLAKKLGIPHVILVSAMGGTDPDNFLNSVGKSAKEKDGHGDILIWKRKAEKYLVESGLDYTILHPGHLVDAPGGLEEYVLGVDDELYKLNHHQQHSFNSTATVSNKKKKRRVTRISREDVAELCVAALSAGKGEKLSFDCITMSPSTISLSPPQPKRKAKRRKRPFGSRATASSPSGAISDSKERLSSESETTISSRKSAEEVLNDFLNLSINTNYDLVA